MVPHAVFTALKDVRKASPKPPLPKMRLGRYEKASWGTAYFLRDVSLTSPKMGFYGKVSLTGTPWQLLYIRANTRRAYQQDIEDFMAFAGLRQPTEVRDVTR